MNKPLLITLALAVLALGCPKAAPQGNTGSDDEQMDGLSAQLEELRTRVQAGEPSCEEWCTLSKKVSGLSSSICQIAERNKDRAEMQQRCVTSQEDVARFNEGCSSCQR